MKKVTAYKCEFCKTPRLFLSRSGAVRHESKCWMNPARKSCGTCSNVYQTIDYITGDANWRCRERFVVPFKRKIDNCAAWIKNEMGIFNDSEEGNDLKVINAQIMEYMERWEG